MLLLLLYQDHQSILHQFVGHKAYFSFSSNSPHYGKILHCNFSLGFTSFQLFVYKGIRCSQLLFNTPLVILTSSSFRSTLSPFTSVSFISCCITSSLFPRWSKCSLFHFFNPFNFSFKIKVPQPCTCKSLHASSTYLSFFFIFKPTLQYLKRFRFPIHLSILQYN